MREGGGELPRQFPYWVLNRFLLKSEGGEGGAPQTISLLISYQILINNIIIVNLYWEYNETSIRNKSGELQSTIILIEILEKQIISIEIICFLPKPNYFYWNFWFFTKNLLFLVKKIVFWWKPNYFLWNFGFFAKN